MIGFSEKEIDEKLQDILDFADIGDYVYQPVKTYSSGMFVRLAFAVAINIDPEILIVDEALSVGDVFFQAKCYHKFEEFKKQGKTILFVSHDLSAISKYCDRAVLLNQGVKLGEGSPRDMIDIYKQVLVGQYELPPEIKRRIWRRMKTSEEQELRRRSDSLRKPRRTAGSDRTGGEKRPDSPRRKEGPSGSGPQHPGVEYGTKEAEIVEYYMTDRAGLRTSAILKGEPFTLHMKVKAIRTLRLPSSPFPSRISRAWKSRAPTPWWSEAFWRA